MVSYRRAVAAGVFVAAALLGASGCSDALTGGEVTKSSYPPVPSLSPPPAGSTTLPADFPKDVPVVPGSYRRHTGGLAGSSSAYVLLVSNVTAADLDKARARLRDAGYEEQEFLGQQTFINLKHAVTLTGAEQDFGYVLTYTVTNTTALPGMPSIPSLTVPDLLGP